MAKGIIYITTTSVTGLIKIGKTGTDQFENRMSILEQNGYWNVNGLKRFFAVEVDDYDEKEKLLHTVFSKSQVATSELFALDKDLAKDMLEAFEGKQVYPPVENTVGKSDRKTPKPRLTFKMIKIPVGSELMFKEDNSIKVKTVDDKNVVAYQISENPLIERKMKLSEAVKFIKDRLGTGNNSGAYQGGLYFLYDGESLVDRRNRMETNWH